MSSSLHHYAKLLTSNADLNFRLLCKISTEHNDCIVILLLGYYKMPHYTILIFKHFHFEFYHLSYGYMNTGLHYIQLINDQIIVILQSKFWGNLISISLVFRPCRDATRVYYLCNVFTSCSNDVHFYIIYIIIVRRL